MTTEPVPGNDEAKAARARGRGANPRRRAREFDFEIETGSRQHFSAVKRIDRLRARCAGRNDKRENAKMR